MHNWEGISEFVAVAETKSFTAASKKLGISTAQVSRQVSRLETRISTKLFIRTTRQVALTELGAIYYHHCSRVLDGLVEAERAITDLQNKITGKLRISAPVIYGERRLAPLIHDFIIQHNELEVELYLTNRQVNLIDESFDLVVRLGELESSSMMAKKLASRTQVVCASPGYIENHGLPVTLNDLNEHNCLRGATDYWRFKVHEKTFNVPVKGNVSCNIGLSLLDAALKGIGVVQLPDYYVSSYIDNNQLIPLLNEYQVSEEGIWALYPNNRYLSPKVRLLIDHLSEKL